MERPIVPALLVAILLPSAALGAYAMRMLAQDAARAQARLRDQAEAAADAGVAAISAAIRALPDDPAALRFRVSAAGELLEPRPPTPAAAPAPPNATEALAWSVVSARVDEAERSGDPGAGAAEIRGFLGGARDPSACAAALTALGATLRRAGKTEEARAAYESLVARFPGTRDARGLRRALVAGVALAELEPTATALPVLARALEEIVADAPPERGVGARAMLEERALAEVRALRARGAAEAPTVAARIAGLEAEMRAGARVRALSAALRGELSSWIASGAPGGARLVDLDGDDARSVVALADGGSPVLRGGARRIDDVLADALARPEVAAFAALGLPAALEGEGRSAPPADAAPILARRPLAAPLERASIVIASVDAAGFAAGERRRAWITGLLIALALLVAGAASVATVRAIGREMQAARGREGFVAAVTHELKTPLASIRLLAELLARGGVEEEKAREFARRVVGETDRLSRLVASVLELSRIEQAPGAAAARRTRVDAADVARAAVETLEPLAARARGFSITLEAAPGLHLQADRDALEGALLNLLDNAVKYSEQPHAIEVVVAPSGAREVSLAVLDRGRGVPDAERERIFEPFARVGDELVRDRPGVGLGLALVRRIALAHGGSASCSPRAGGGSVFSIVLPRDVGGAA